MSDNSKKFLSANRGKDKFKKSDWSHAVSRWGSYASPFRPSKEDIKNYSRSLKETDRKKILLLGATPEIREILSGSKSFIADFSQSMFEGMLFSDAKIDESEETWIKADWMTLNEFFKNDYFDAVIGDLVLRNIEPDFQKDFLKKISSMLKKDGCFITRTHFLNEELVEQNAYEVISTVLDKSYNIENRLVEDLITSRLFDKNTNLKTQIVDKKNFALDIYKYAKMDNQDKKTKKLMDGIIKKWVGPRTWTQRTEKEIIHLFSLYFNVADKRASTDYQDAEFYPLCTLFKK